MTVPPGCATPAMRAALDAGRRKAWQTNRENHYRNVRLVQKLHDALDACGDGDVRNVLEEMLSTAEGRFFLVGMALKGAQKTTPAELAPEPEPEHRELSVDEAADACLRRGLGPELLRELANRLEARKKGATTGATGVATTDG